MPPQGGAESKSSVFKSRNNNREVPKCTCCCTNYLTAFLRFADCLILVHKVADRQLFLWLPAKFGIFFFWLFPQHLFVVVIVSFHLQTCKLHYFTALSAYHLIVAVCIGYFIVIAQLLFLIIVCFLVVVVPTFSSQQLNATSTLGHLQWSLTP